MIYIILPAYNEEISINSLFRKIHAVMSENNYNYKIIFINDGSRDNSLARAIDHSIGMPLEIINHNINRGLWETVRDGFERAAELSSPGDIIIRMDCDDTHDPKYIPSMVEKINEGYDVVITSRFQRGSRTHGLDTYRTVISRIANLVMKFFFPIRGVWEYSCGYRAYRAEIVRDALAIFGNAFIDLKGLGFTCTLEKLIKFKMMGAKFVEVPFELRYDLKKSSSKMVSSITTLGYIILIIKYIHPWGKTTRGWLKQIEARKAMRNR